MRHGTTSRGARVAALVSVLLVCGAAAASRPGHAPRPTHSPTAERGAAATRRLAASGVSEGVVSTGADAWHRAGYTGKGVTVAVIDSGFKGWTSVPGASLAYTQCGDAELNGSDHGAAVAQIVDQMAPDASILLYCVGDETQLANAVSAAVGRTPRVDIIVESLSWFNGSRGDGQNPSSASPEGVAATARAAGILWVNSAGNFAQRHWSGSFVDNDHNGWNEFIGTDEGNTVAIPGHGSACFDLKWDSWPPAQPQDFDLYLFRQVGSSFVDRVTGTSGSLARSINRQTASQLPVEELCWTNPAGDRAYVFAAIDRVGTTATPRFDLFITADDLQYQTAAGSVAEPATSPSVLAVGAACWQDNKLEPYSSQGPTIDGRVKPDLVGPDSVSSPFSDFGNFSGSCQTSGFRGSSAAAPHVAGAAALVLSRYPSWTPAQVQSYLEQNALDLGPKGKDNSSGSGMLRLPGFPPPPPPAPPPPPPKLRIFLFDTLPAHSQAGAPFRARAVVTIGGSLLSSGRVSCSAEVGSRRLRARTAGFRDELARCGWDLPRSAGGKVLRGSLRVTYKRGTVSRAFSQRVKQSPHRTRG